jgi:type III pantothenate kinase
VQDWQNKFPDSKIVLTGGDALLLATYLQELDPIWLGQLVVDPDLIFTGIRAILNRPNSYELNRQVI